MSLAQTLAELDMCSHVSAAGLEPTARDSGEDQGGRRPPGGVDGREDHHREPGPRQPERLLRSADYYRKQLAKGKPADRIEEEALLSLDAWRKLPPPAKSEWPDKGSSQWRRWVAESERSPEEIGRHYFVSRRYIAKIRADFQVPSA